jgi:hypothetical protein
MERLLLRPAIVVTVPVVGSRFGVGTHGEYVLVCCA